MQDLLYVLFLVYLQLMVSLVMHRIKPVKQLETTSLKNETHICCSLRDSIEQLFDMNDLMLMAECDLGCRALMLYALVYIAGYLYLEFI